MNLLPRSIALRLTVSIGAIALVIFSATGSVLYRSLALALSDAAHAELSGKIESVKRFLDEAPGNAGALGGLREHLQRLQVEHPWLRVWLISAEGQPLYGGTAPRLVRAAGEHGHVRVVRDDGVEMEAMREMLSTGSALPGGQLVVAFEMRGRDQALANYRDALVLVCASAVLLTIALSAAAAWRGLAPVKRLSEEAARITPKSPTARLSDARVDAELVGLVKAFNGALDRLSTAYRQMEAFNADVAHELRTPLATLISGNQVMLSASRSPAELRQTIASNLEDLEQLNRLVTDMLFLARSDRGATAEGLQEANLAEQADRAIDFCEPLLEEGGVQASREGAGRARCNAALIQRALVNLLSNAIKHTERGQQIRVRIESARDKVRLSVFNPGVPIPAEVASRMFDRFYRADTARARTGESHGLGLSIVSAIARMHGGATFVTTEPAGNRIGIEIPVGATTERPSPSATQGPVAA